MEKSASTCAAVWERGESARFLMGRLERGSAEVGIDSGMFSDMFVKPLFVSPLCVSKIDRQFGISMVVNLVCVHGSPA